MMLEKKKPPDADTTDFMDWVCQEALPRAGSHTATRCH